MIPALSAAVLLAAATAAPPPPRPAADESAAIKKAALDYIEGWYAGDAARMERSLHPELAKRIVETDAKSGESRLESMGAMALVQATRAGWGKGTPPEKQQKDATVLDVYRGAASVKIVATDWIDYLHLAKWNGEWKIVNVLWAWKPRATEQPAP
jgi:hypothetical protein